LDLACDDADHGSLPSIISCLSLTLQTPFNSIPPMSRNRHQIDSLLISWLRTSPKRLVYSLVAITVAMIQICTGVIPAQAATPAVLVQQGKIAYERGNFPTALTNWEQAEVAYRQERDAVGVAGSQVNQAQALMEMGLYRRACKTLAGTGIVDRNVCATTIPAQLGLRRTNLPPAMQALVLGTLGDVLRQLGNLDAAQVTLAMAGEVAKPLRSEDRSPILLSIANTLRDLGNRDLDRTNRLSTPSSSSRACPLQPLSNLKAAEYYQRSIACYQQAGSLTAQINQLSLQVEISRWLDTPAQRLVAGNWQPQFNQSTLINQIQTQLLSQSFTDEALNQRINFARSLVLAPTPQSSAARELLEQVITQGRVLDRKSVLATAIGTLGWLYEQKHQWAEAIEFTQQALVLVATPEDDNRYEWEWQLGRILQHQSQPDLVRAKARYDRAIAALAQTRQNLRVINPDAQFSLRDRIEPLYRESIDLSLRMEHPDLANIIDRVDALKLVELENFLQCQLDGYRPINKFAQAAGAVVFYPVILTDRLEVILQLADGQFHRFIVPVARVQLEATIDRYQASLSQPQYGWDNQAASDLYDWLIRPAQKYLNPQTKNLVFVMDGALQNIPLAALFDRSSREYLIDRYPLAVTPGLQILGAKQSIADRAQILIGGLTTRSSVVPNGKRGGIFDPLAYAESEVEGIKSLFPRSTVLVGKNFTQTNLQQVLASERYSIVHLATHGQFSSDPRQTFIVTAAGQTIDLDRLRSILPSGQSHSIELIVLSACETATGDRRAALGLAGTAIRSGAASTLASMWAVDDRASAQLMQQFYGALTQPQHLSKAQALRVAQRAMRQEYEHPYYWAPFVLVGNWL
jgi:CHAT domain-containing protein